jgi:predicted DNA-binding transcriptional regulator YafY
VKAVSNRIHRLLLIVSYLQSGHAMDSSALAEICGVSRRTVFRDLRSLRDADMQIDFSEQEQRYVLKGNDLMNVGLSRDELYIVCLICHILPREQPGLSHETRTTASSVAAKLSSLLSQEGRDRLCRLSKATVIELDARERTEYSHSVCEVIQQAIERNRRVRIRYSDCQVDKDVSTLLSPFHMVWRPRGCRIIGRSSRHRRVQSFNLCDIRNAELTGQDFTIPSRFNLKRFSKTSL